MMKKILLLLFLFSGIAARAQHNASDQIISNNWDVIGNVQFRIVKDTQLIPKYTPEIRKFENKAYELEGYLVPIKEGLKQTKFMLSTLPINQCYFCGKNGVPVMVMVELSQPIKFTYQTITVKGTLKLNDGNAMYNPPIALLNALVTK